MQFTKTAQEKILNTVRESPLQETEYRRIEGMGAMYVARDEAPAKSGYHVLMTVKLDQVPHKICMRADRDT